MIEPDDCVTVKGKGLGKVIEMDRARGGEWRVRIKWDNGKISSYPESKVKKVSCANREPGGKWTVER